MKTRRILYVQYTNPGGYPPLEHSSRILADQGWNVVFLGTGAHGADALRFPPHQRIRVHRLSFMSGGLLQKVQYVFYCFWVLTWSVLWRPHVVYASDPLACPSSLLVWWLCRRPIIYHEHDAPAGTDQPVTPFMRLVFRSRILLAKCARAIVIPNEARADRFRMDTGTDRPVLVVWNCPRTDEIATISVPDLQGLRLFYHGSLVPERLPLAILEAMAAIPQLQLTFAGYETVGSRGYVSRLMTRAQELSVANRVSYLGALPARSDLLTQCRTHHVGLAIMPLGSTDLNFQAMTGASNKPFDYLASGLALIVSDLPSWRELFVDNGYAIACNPNDPQSIVVALRWFLEHPTERKSMALAGRRCIATNWNYEAQFQPVLELLQRISR